MSRSSLSDERPNRARRKVMRECGVGSLPRRPFHWCLGPHFTPTRQRRDVHLTGSSSLPEVDFWGKHVGSTAAAPDPAAKMHLRRW
jgi:hypothetical protein